MPGIDEALYEHLEEHLMSQNVYLTDAGCVDGTLELVYETVLPTGGVPPRQVGTVVVSLREFEGWDPQNVGATVTNPDGVVHGTWEVREEWLRALDAGDISEEEFSRRAIEAVRAWGPRTETN
ncbi:hypothetical protein [Halomarina ordinaria]|uniref:DUF8159 domain-containing protein n=1 Tax=Halomarina ordinaria TaxID=3033939 RepID=A0ABD5U8J4_9EURY|nr:hypothetical protein [Halomarina sp. PSRA2]